RFGEPILPVKDVPDVDLETGEAELVIESGEQGPGAGRHRECLLVAAAQNQRLNRGIQCAGCFLGVPGPLERIESIAMQVEGLGVSSECPEGVGFRAACLRKRGTVIAVGGEHCRGACTLKREADVDTKLRSRDVYETGERVSGD